VNQDRHTSPVAALPPCLLASCSVLLLVLVAGCSRPEPAQGPWHDEAGTRWRELAGAGRLTPGFTRLTASITGIDFSNTVSDSASFRNRHLMDGSGVAIGDVNGDGRPDLYLCRIEGPNALYLNQGGWSFREAASQSGVALGDRPSTGAVFADVDGDGDLDLIVTSMGGRNSLFRNDGAGKFTDATAGSGFVGEGRGSTTAALADVDGDGDLDLYVANYKARTMLDSLSPQERAFDQVVRKVGARYEVIPERREDYRLRERPELHGVTLIQRADPDWFYLNDGMGRFVREPIAHNPRFLDQDGTPLAEEPEDFGLAARFHDVNGDGAPDLYVANDFEDPDQFWVNDGSGRFHLVPREGIRRTANSNMAVDFADIDRDGDVDLFQVDMLANDSRRAKTQVPTHTPLAKQPGEATEPAQWQRNALLINRGDGSFAEIADYAGVAASGWSWSAMFLDVDLDGYEDLLIGTGHTWDLMDADTQERLKSTVTGVGWREERKLYPPLKLPNVAFRNRGDLTFEDAGATWRWSTEADISHGIAAGDLDGDGDLDVVINRLNAPAAIMRNDAVAARIAVRAIGKPPNRFAIGARIRVIGPGQPEQSREVTVGGLYLSGSDQEYAFAAGSGSALSIEVHWRNGTISRVSDARPGRRYEVMESTAVGRDALAPPVLPSSRPPVLFEDVSSRLGARHAEEPFNDFARQPLLDLQLSQLGPGVSWIDVDADGDDDLVVPDGAGGELAWYRNDPRGWAKVSLGVPAGELDFTMALGFPAPQGTGLLVGRSTYRVKTMASAFELAPVAHVVLSPSGGRRELLAAIGPDTASVGPMALADVDGDSDLDLFVGNRVTPGTYPVPPSSHLYLNQNGRFARDSSNEAALRLVGLVSGAVFTDADGDGQPDLVLATEWGPLKLLRNDRGRFYDVTGQWGLAGFLGGWKGVTAGDLDGDGRMDLIATNWGRNLPVVADSTNPLNLYVGNFGDTPAVDFLAARYDARLQAIAPVTSLSRIAWAIPSIRKRTRTFADYADASIEKVIGPAFPNTLRLQMNTMEHMVFLNRGGRFEARALPSEAQWAPAFAAVIADFDGDGREDVFLGQNFSQTEIGTPRLDAGRGLLLIGDGAGGLQPVPGQRSGIVIYGDQRGAAASDYDGDARTDLAVSQNAGPTRLLHNLGAKPGLRVRLEGGVGNPSGVGAAMRVRYSDGDGPAREIHAGSGYWSEDGMVQVLGLRAAPKSVWIRWPGGGTTEALIPPGATTITIGRE
jgi:hypothetical protein